MLFRSGRRRARPEARAPARSGRPLSLAPCPHPPALKLSRCSRPRPPAWGCSCCSSCVRRTSADCGGECCVWLPPRGPWSSDTGTLGPKVGLRIALPPPPGSTCAQSPAPRQETRGGGACRSCRPPLGAFLNCHLDVPTHPLPPPYILLYFLPLCPTPTAGYALNPGHRGISGWVGKEIRGDGGKICSLRSE